MSLSRQPLMSLPVLAVLLAAAPAYAQSIAPTQPNTGFGIGVLGGLTFTTQSTEENQFNLDTTGETGFLLGAWVGVNRDGLLGLTGELSYVTKRLSVTYGTIPPLRSKSEYVEVPVLLRINIGARSGSKPSLYFVAGPVFDINFGGQEDGEDDSYESTDIGLMVGAGLEVNRVGIEGRYSWGLQSALSPAAATLRGFGSAKLNTLQIVGKFRFN